MTTPTDPIPEFRLGADRYARREPVAGREVEAEGVDPETQEVVETFEALYAELSSAAPAPAPDAAPGSGRDDDLSVDVPDEFEPAAVAAHAVRSRARADTSRRGQDRPAPARVQAAPRDADPAPDLDAAFAMLRAAESKGRQNAERDAVDREEQRAVTALTSVHRASHASQNAQGVRRLSAGGGLEREKARALWTKVAAAAAIALIVGAGLGYLVGRAPDPAASVAKIPVSPQGGARLQFDYELSKY